ncbi:MAG: lipoyl(octanoyl) transferase LipB [Desulfarculaceae bacterium]|nr:lipoyl(octanoyl) transferase LipB [Desulfarculaceae bacterium]MCF8048966.1 lipoyl(octanoyl) transferase LipB [Desulfarculaceae bacterium]MCF8065247.1 lipoyl(octanoyl) transferase LipB [Desulfarculaceae bacterium]
MANEPFKRINWGLIPYPQALERMRRLHAARAQGKGRDMLICCEHPHVLTLGRHAEPGHILLNDEELAAKGMSVFNVERGGQVTYHGPGQAVVYLVVALLRRKLGVRRLVEGITQAVCDAAADFGVKAAGDPQRPGAWVGGRKLAAIGLAVRQGVTMHGLAMNVSTNLSYFGYIKACGLDAATTSLERESGGHAPSMTQAHDALCAHLGRELAGAATA